MLTVVIAIALQIPHFGLMAVSAHPDFSGTWKIDRKLSTYELLRDLEDLVFVISQSDESINVKRIIKEKKHKERIKELTYYADGRGEKVSFLFSNEKWNSKTIWVEGSLVSKFTVTEYESTSSDFYYYDYTETWSLSKDSKLLTIKTDIAVRNVPNFLRNRITSSSYAKVFQRME